jgi:hypothetical protein
MKYQFTEHSVSSETWEVEAETLEEAVAGYARRRRDGDPPDDDTVDDAELVQVTDDQDHEYDVDQILKMLPDEEP